MQISEQVSLYSQFKLKRGFRRKGILYSYDGSPNSPAILILPGGAYCNVAHVEWEPIAEAYKELGYNTFVLEYSVRRSTHFPVQLSEAAAAVIYIRKNREKYGHNGKVFVCGFSAGGHLAGTVANFYDSPEIKKLFGNDFILARPDATVLCYPVITSIVESASHKLSFYRLAKKNDALKKRLSLESQVNKNTPPSFLWHAKEDDCVPYINSVLYYDALVKNGIKAEIALYDTGRHGMGLAKGHEAESWLSRSDAFLKSI